MTLEQFNNTGFGGAMKIQYRGVIYPLVTVDFEECLFGFRVDDQADIQYARVENCELVED